MTRRVWNVRTVVDAVNVKRGWQAGVYEVISRSADGMPVYRLAEKIGPVYPWSDQQSAERQGRTSGLERDHGARNMAIALDVSDLMAPEVESLWRLGKLTAALLWGSASSKTDRVVVCYATRCVPTQRRREASNEYLYKVERRIGAMTPKQRDELVDRLKMVTRQIRVVPRLTCALIWVEEQ